MQLKIPPPVIFAISLLSIYSGAFFTKDINLALPGQIGLALVFAVSGLLLGALAVASFLRARTTINPHSPAATTTLVTSGIFALSRNPMYLGLLFLLVAAAFHSGSPVALVSVPGFVWYITAFQILPEEEKLAELFGEDFTSYCLRVRRWI